MYICGNAKTFLSARTTTLWASVIDGLAKAGQVGEAIPLRCQNPEHADDGMLARTPAEFQTFAGDGGCSRQCAFRRPCGHSCRRRYRPWALL